MRFKESNGHMTYLFCTAVSSESTYSIETSSLHLDTRTSIYIGGQIKSENFFYYRTGVEMGDS